MKKAILSYLGIFLLVCGAIWQVSGCAKNRVMNMVPAVVPVDTVTATPATDTGKVTYLALGDSYTIGQSVSVNDRYPVQAAVLLHGMGMTISNPDIIATTGWTTGDLLNALKNKSANPPYTIVSLLIGVNNQYQGLSIDDYKTQFTALLQQSIQLAGNNASHVVVLSIPDYSVTPFAASGNRAAIASAIDAFNAVNKAVSAQYQVHYLDVTTASRMAANDPTLIASDSLHFSGKEYAVWAAMMAPMFKNALQ